MRTTQLELQVRFADGATFFAAFDLPEDGEVAVPTKYDHDHQVYTARAWRMAGDRLCVVMINPFDEAQRAHYVGELPSRRQGWIPLVKQSDTTGDRIDWLVRTQRTPVRQRRQ